MTVTIPTPLTIPRVGRIADDQNAMEQLTDGLSNAVATLGIPEMDESYDLNGDDEHPAVGAWQQEVADPVVAEIAPAVAALLQAAIDKRLPWSFPA